MKNIGPQRLMSTKKNCQIMDDNICIAVVTILYSIYCANSIYYYSTGNLV
jgi:hypothetical protein